MWWDKPEKKNYKKILLSSGGIAVFTQLLTLKYYTPKLGRSILAEAFLSYWRTQQIQILKNRKYISTASVTVKEENSLC